MEENNDVVEIQWRNAGPIVVKGKVILKDNDGNEIETGKLKVISLCGCKKTLNPPFCDGMHKKL